MAEYGGYYHILDKYEHPERPAIRVWKQGCTRFDPQFLDAFHWFEYGIVIMRQWVKSLKVPRNGGDWSWNWPGYDQVTVCWFSWGISIFEPSIMSCTVAPCLLSGTATSLLKSPNWMMEWFPHIISYPIKPVRLSDISRESGSPMDTDESNQTNPLLSGNPEMKWGIHCLNQEVEDGAVSFNKF